MPVCNTAFHNISVWPVHLKEEKKLYISINNCFLFASADWAKNPRSLLGVQSKYYMKNGVLFII
jgi:hypothetical protein